MKHRVDYDSGHRRTDWLTEDGQQTVITCISFDSI